MFSEVDYVWEISIGTGKNLPVSLIFVFVEEILQIESFDTVKQSVQSWQKHGNYLAPERW